MTLAAQLATLPLIIFYFGNLSLVAPLVNLLLLPLFSYLMISGFGIILASLAFAEISQYLFWVVWLILTYMIGVVDFFSHAWLVALKF